MESGPDVGKTQLTADWVGTGAGLVLQPSTPVESYMLGKDDRGLPKPPQGVTRVSIAAHRIAYVLPGQEAQADSHDDPGGSEPAAAASAGLGIWPLPHQLPRGAPPLPVALGPHVPEGSERLGSRVEGPIQGQAVGTSGYIRTLRPISGPWKYK